MRHQDYPSFYQILVKLGFGISGIIHLVCASPALAVADTVKNAVEQRVQSAVGTNEQFRDSLTIRESLQAPLRRNIGSRDREEQLSPTYLVSDRIGSDESAKAEAVVLKSQISLNKADIDVEGDTSAELIDPTDLTEFSVPASIRLEIGTDDERASSPEMVEAEVVEAEVAEAEVVTAEVAATLLQPVAAAADLQLKSEDDLRAEGDELDLLSELLAQEDGGPEVFPLLDEELGTLRLVRLRSRENEELGILRILRTAAAVPPPPPTPVAFLTGRLGVVDVDNVFRSDLRIDEQVYQAGIGLYLAPQISESTSLYGIVETNIARYDSFSAVNYNEVQLQLGLRQKLSPRTYAQAGWRNQRLYSPGYREKLFGAQYLDALISHRSILTPRSWLDSFYQVRLGFADPETASRFRQTFTLSLNYSISRDFRTSLLYQLDFDDYTQIARYDTYQQILGVASYSLTPESRLSVFGGTRFGRSSNPNINLDDTFYGAGLNVNVSLF